jgi:hypothetical protein
MKATLHRVLLALPRHCQLNAKDLYISAVTRKLEIVFFFHDRLYFRHLYPVSFPHEEGVCERLFIKLTMPPRRFRCKAPPEIRAGGEDQEAHSPQERAEKPLAITADAQFLTLCSAYNLAGTQYISSPWQGSSPATTRVASMRSRAHGYPVRPATNCEKLSDPSSRHASHGSSP